MQSCCCGTRSPVGFQRSVCIGCRNANYMLLDPCMLATAGTAPVVVSLFFERRRGARGVASEQRILAAVLVVMPLVYVMRALETGIQSTFWLEALGIPLFCGAALLGLLRSPWCLVVGIASHGFAWDVWHYARCSYVPDWYSAYCFVVDFALAVYVASRIPTYNRFRFEQRHSR